MDDIKVLPMIKRVMKSKRINHAEIARGLQMHPTSISGMFSRSTLQVQRLAELSVLFEYNFFREIAEKLPYAEPAYSELESNQENLHLQNRIKELELEVKILRQTIRDLAGK